MVKCWNESRDEGLVMNYVRFINMQALQTEDMCDLPLFLSFALTKMTKQEIASDFSFAQHAHGLFTVRWHIIVNPRWCTVVTLSMCRLSIEHSLDHTLLRRDLY